MGNNVKEWMMDIYSENPRHYTSIEAIYWQNGLHLSKPSEYCNRDGYIVDKDSLGHLPFRTMGYHANGNDIWVSRFPYEPKNYSGAYRVVKSGNWKHPSLKAREKVYDKGASAEIGFRTVMQYNGIPIDTKYMVNWK